MTFKTILCGTDGSADAQNAVEHTAQLAQQLGADVVLVHAIGLLELCQKTLTIPRSRSVIGPCSSSPPTGQNGCGSLACLYLRRRRGGHHCSRYPGSQPESTLTSSS